MHRRFIDSDKSVATTIRIGYPGTGFAFYMTRCHDKEQLKSIVPKKLRKGKLPQAFCGYSLCPSLGAQLLEESVGGVLCEIQLAALATDDLREELRHWRHEIGHAADFARQMLPAVLAAAAAAKHSDADPAKRAHALAEIPAAVTELLCDALDIAFGGSDKGAKPQSELPDIIAEAI